MIEELVVRPRFIERHKIETDQWSYPYEYNKVRGGALGRSAAGGWEGGRAEGRRGCLGLCVECSCCC